VSRHCTRSSEKRKKDRILRNDQRITVYELKVGKEEQQDCIRSSEKHRMRKEKPAKKPKEAQKKERVL